MNVLLQLNNQIQTFDGEIMLFHTMHNIEGSNRIGIYLFILFID